MGACCAKRTATVFPFDEVAQNQSDPRDDREAHRQTLTTEDDTELPFGLEYEECWQQLAYNKQKLQQLLKWKHKSLLWLRYSIDELRKLVGDISVDGAIVDNIDKEIEDIIEEENGCVYAGARHEDESGYNNEEHNEDSNFEEDGSADSSEGNDDAGKLEMLLVFEEHLRLLQTSENAVHLQNEITRAMRQCWRGRLPVELKYRLYMMWKTTDSVWLLGWWQGGSMWLLQKTRAIMERIYPIAAGKKKHQQSLFDSSQLFTMFHERLHQWQHHANCVKFLCLNIKDMLEGRLQHHAWQTMAATELHEGRRWSTGNSDKITPSGCQKLPPPIRRSNSEKYLRPHRDIANNEVVQHFNWPEKECSPKLDADRKHELRLVKWQHTRLLRLRQSMGVLQHLVRDISAEGNISEYGDSGDSTDEDSGDSSEEENGNTSEEDIDESVESSEEENGNTSEEDNRGDNVNEMGRDSSEDENEYINTEEKGSRKRNQENDSAKKLTMLLKFEQHICLLHNNENASQMWKMIIRHLRIYWRGRLPVEWKYRLRMAWKSKDSVWLLTKTRFWYERSFWLLQKVHNTMERISPNTARTEEHSEPLFDLSQLVTTFEERLRQWRNEADTLRHIDQFLVDMLGCQPRRHVQQTILGAKLYERRTRNTEDIDKVIPNRCLTYPPPIRRANSEQYLCHHRYMVLYDVMLEVAFPTAAIFQLTDSQVRHNQSTLSDLTSGQDHHEGGVRELWDLIAGSTAEGLAVETAWGYEWPDVDGMILFGAQLGVCVTQEHMSTRQHHPLNTSSSSSSSGCHGNSRLEYDPEGCPPAYTRLRVTDRQALLTHPCVDDSCMVECDGHYWLLSTPLIVAIQRFFNQVLPDPADHSTSISGPAGQALGGLADIVPTLVANKPHPAIVDYINRLSSPEWPSQEQRQLIQQLPMNLVLVGHKDSARKDQEFRLSWSIGELVLILTLPNHIKQGYIAFKYVMKRFIKMNRGQNETDHGRSKIGSFHFKNTLLHHLENTNPSMISSPFGLMMVLIIKFKGYLNRGKLPHYFLPECDLLATVGPEERQIAHKSINDILSDPVSAVLKCPSVPTEIYGDIVPDELVSIFHRVSTRPCCERSRDELLLLLSRLDEWRQQHYHRQLEVDNDEDEGDRVSGRPELRGLVWAILEQIKHM